MNEWMNEIQRTFAFYLFAVINFKFEKFCYKNSKMYQNILFNDAQEIEIGEKLLEDVYNSFRNIPHLKKKFSWIISI